MNRLNWGQSNFFNSNYLRSSDDWNGDGTCFIIITSENNEDIGSCSPMFGSGMQNEICKIHQMLAFAVHAKFVPYFRAVTLAFPSSQAADDGWRNPFFRFLQVLVTHISNEACISWANSIGMSVKRARSMSFPIPYKSHLEFHHNNDLNKSGEYLLNQSWMTDESSSSSFCLPSFYMISKCLLTMENQPHLWALKPVSNSAEKRLIFNPFIAPWFLVITCMVIRPIPRKMHYILAMFMTKPPVHPTLPKVCCPPENCKEVVA